MKVAEAVAELRALLSRLPLDDASDFIMEEGFKSDLVKFKTLLLIPSLTNPQDVSEAELIRDDLVNSPAGVSTQTSPSMLLGSLLVWRPTISSSGFMQTEDWLICCES